MPPLIGLDWGTTSLCAYRMDSAGRVSETRERPWGTRQLPAGGFAKALTDILADWSPAAILACGMVGNRQGWREAPYADVPAGTSQLARGLISLVTDDGRTLHIVPGLRNVRGSADVMRGEETQLIGGMALAPDTASRSTWVLPGTHSKWASVRDGVVTDFATAMTGELFAVLRQHSILGVGMGDTPDTDTDAFLRGVRAARDSDAAGGFSRLFSTRSLMLAGELPATSTADYLSGLLIGEEFRSMLARQRFDTRAPVQLIGSSHLCACYRRAATCFDVAIADVLENATAAGLWQIACAGGLIDKATAPASRMAQ